MNTQPLQALGYAGVVERLKARGLVRDGVPSLSGKIIKFPKPVKSPPAVKKKSKVRTGWRSDLVLRALAHNGGQADHLTLARTLGIETHRLCCLLSNLKRRGLVMCVRKSGMGVGCRPGLWALAEGSATA